MQLQKRCMMLFFAFLLFCSMSVTVYAHKAPDTSKEGSIMVTMTYENKAVPGGMLTLYKVGNVKEEDGNYSFVLTDDFADSHVSLENIQSDQLAKTLATFASDKKMTGTTKKIENDGSVTFPNLELGLYLLVQTDAASGYHSADPFLVSVPMYEDGTYLYDVDGTPKVELEKRPTPTTPSSPTTPSIPTLPQTGQLNWPIPILAILGLMMFSVGWILRFGRKRDNYEK